jgi:hypothetical protein
MAQFSKKTQTFLKEAGQDPKRVGTPIEASAGYITPGDILIFRYYNHLWKKYGGVGSGSREQRVVLVVKTRRGDGIFMASPKSPSARDGDFLMSAFNLGGRSEEVVDAIIENLYKKRRRASYYGLIKQSLQKLLGPDSFRTYRLKGMKSVYKLSLRN